MVSGHVREHLFSIHSLSDRDLALDGGHPVRGASCLSAVAGRAPAPGRLSDHSDLREPAGRQPGDDGVLRRSTARAPVCADPRHRADDIDELARLDLGHDPVRPRSKDRRGGWRCSGCDQRGRRAAAEEPAFAADLSQGQPGGFADHDPVGDLGRAAADDGERPHRRAACAADQPDLRCRPGLCRRPAKAFHPHPDRSGEARRQRPVAGGRAQPGRDRDRR